MRGENNTKRGMVRGSLFETVLRILLEQSGFSLVRPGRNMRGRCA